jgi:predicted short-subunit dehydrogenase-like oxidoreductase (DUF2520 family)
MVKRLSIIGCGKVGTTLGFLWLRQGTFCLVDILDQSSERASNAVADLHAGRALVNFDELEPADIYLIATPDQAIGEASLKLAAANILTPGNIVFHCSGVTPSSLLSAARDRGAAIASVHPIKSFADPAQAAANFAGTFCGVEGNLSALNILRPAFEAIGGIPFDIDPEKKALYHAATVFVSNYLTTLIEIGARALEASGMSRQTAFDLIEPIAKGTVQNIFEMGPVHALTGPIARGDVQTVGCHLQALASWQKPVADIYRQLGVFTLELSRRQGSADPAQLDQLSHCLGEETE